MDAVFSVVDFVVLAAYLVGIPMCLMKGRAWFGAFALFMLVTSTVLGLQAFRYAREDLIAEWWWSLFKAQGLAVAALIVAVALKSPKEGSWWDRHRGEHTAPTPRQAG